MPEWLGLQYKLFLLLAMLFCHIVDDYYLQGILAKMKQKKWWEDNADDYIYRNDYKIALAEHAFSWDFVTSIPIVAFYFICGKTETLWLVICFIIFNTTLHAYIDNLKANRKTINLIQDQTAHILQIVLMWIWCCLYAL